MGGEIAIEKRGKGVLKNRTCTFQRIRLKQAGEGPVARRLTIRSHRWSASPAGPFTATVVAASNLSVGAGVVVIIFSPLAHLTASVSALSRPGTRPGIRPVIQNDRVEDAAIVSRFPVAFPQPAFASRSSDSRRGVGRSSRSAYRRRQSAFGPRRGSRVPHARAATGVGATYTPRTAVPSRTEGRAQPAPAASRRPVLAPRSDIPPRGALLHEASTRVQRFTRPVFPSPLAPGWNGRPWAFPRASHPAVTGGARRGWGQAIEHGPETTLTTSAEPPILRVHSLRATSRRTVRSRRLRRRSRDARFRRRLLR